MFSHINFGRQGRKIGSSYWLVQRLSAVLLIPIALWFVWGALPHLLQDPLSVRVWFGDPVHAIGVGIWTILLFWHGFLGMRVVCEDYIKDRVVRAYVVLALALLTLVAMVYAVGQIFVLGVTVL